MRNWIIAVCLIVATSITMAYSYEDVTAPSLTGFTLSPLTVNTSSGQQTITATFTVTDALSGFWQGSIALYGPTSSQYQLIAFDSSNRISGTANNGVYQVSLVFPQYANTGTWNVSNINLIDAVGNSVILNRLSCVNGYGASVPCTNPAFLGYSSVSAY